FRLLFAGTVASMIGDSILLLVLAMWVKDLTGSAGAAGAVILGVVLPALAGPAFGYVVDRVRRRPFLIAVNVLSAVALLPLLAVHDRSDIWIVYAVSLAYGVSFVFNDAGLAALLKRMLPDAELAQANGAAQTVKQGLRLVGPLLGAGLYAVTGTGWVVAIDALSFLLAAGALALLRLPEQVPVPTGQHWTAQVTAGIRHLWGDPALRRTVLACAAVMVVFGCSESIVWAYLDHGLHRPTAFVGVLSSAQGVGGIVGGLLAARLIRRYGEVAVTAAGLAAVGVAMSALAVPALAVGLASFSLFGAAL